MTDEKGDEPGEVEGDELKMPEEDEEFEGEGEGDREYYSVEEIKRKFGPYIVFNQTIITGVSDKCNIQILSDLHLEFEDKLRLKQSPKAFTVPLTWADVIVLAGDIGNKHRGIDFAYRTSSKLKKPVIYVAGNHEYWGSVFQDYTGKVKEHETELKKVYPKAEVHFLDNSSVEIKGVKFLGTTLWTNMTDASISSRLNDYSKIRFRWQKDEKTAYKKIQPRQVAARHERDLAWLKSELEEKREPGQKIVVVTHHPPHPDCIAPKFRGDVTNAAYANDLTDLLKSEYAPNLWISGHTHHACDFKVGKTRIVSNPRGYPHESQKEFDAELIVSV